MSAPKVDVLGILDVLQGEVFAAKGHIEAAPIWQARTAMNELIEADREFDAAADALAAAKREKGSWRTNPLGHGHPAVLRMRAAKARRAAAIDCIGGAA